MLLDRPNAPSYYRSGGRRRAPERRSNLAEHLRLAKGRLRVFGPSESHQRVVLLLLTSLSSLLRPLLASVWLLLLSPLLVARPLLSSPCCLVEVLFIRYPRVREAAARVQHECCIESWEVSRYEDVILTSSDLPKIAVLSLHIIISYLLLVRPYGTNRTLTLLLCVHCLFCTSRRLLGVRTKIDSWN